MIYKINIVDKKSYRRQECGWYILSTLNEVRCDMIWSEVDLVAKLDIDARKELCIRRVERAFRLQENFFRHTVESMRVTDLAKVIATLSTHGRGANLTPPLLREGLNICQSLTSEMTVAEDLTLGWDFLITAVHRLYIAIAEDRPDLYLSIPSAVYQSTAERFRNKYLEENGPAGEEELNEVERSSRECTDEIEWQRKQIADLSCCS